MADIKKRNIWFKRIFLTGLILLTAGGFAIWYIFTEKFNDTSKEPAAYTFNAMELIKKFQTNDSIANTKYAEKIITVKGRVFETESADTTINIKMMDTLTDAYIIFAFQQEHLNEAKLLRAGDSVSIKGSCSGGTYSKILETEFITFKRCTVNK